MDVRSVSIAMTTFNGEAYLEEQLESFAAQNRLPDELVVCDDGSADGTIAILERFRARAPFAVHVHRNERNLGLSANFEKALSLCAGDIIFLSDQDDVWLPHKLGRVLEVFDSEPEAMLVINDQVVCDADLSNHGVTILDNLASLGLHRDYFVPGCSTAMRSEWRRYALPIPPGLVYDHWINKLGEHLGLRIILREPLQYYRRHGSNNSADSTSSSTRASKLSLSRSWDGDSVKAGWRAVIADSQVYIDRIESRAPALRRLGAGVSPEQAIRHLRSRNAALERRMATLDSPRYARPLQVLALLAAGGYKPFQGWKSAARDLAR